MLEIRWLCCKPSAFSLSRVCFHLVQVKISVCASADVDRREGRVGVVVLLAVSCVSMTCAKLNDFSRQMIECSCRVQF